MFVLTQRYDTEILMRRAEEIDSGFDRAVFASMLGSLGRFDDHDLPLSAGSAAALRAFFRRWQRQLQDDPGVSNP